MEPQNIINILFGMVLALLAWFGKEVWAAIQELKRSLGTTQRELPEKYVQKEDMKDALGEMRDLLHRIWDKLDSKADKS